MANMSYCRFENTLRDLQDCRDAMEHPSDEASESEALARRLLIELCKEIAERGDDWVSEAAAAATEEQEAM